MTRSDARSPSLTRVPRWRFAWGALLVAVFIALAVGAAYTGFFTHSPW